MNSYQSFTVKKYLEVLASREPVPGGGSAAALVASLGVALISMVAHYSKGKNFSVKIDKRIDSLLKETQNLRARLLRLVDLDAQAYLKVIQARKKSSKAKQAALKQASEVPHEVCHLCYKAVNLLPFLVKYGNKYLQSDLEVALEMLNAAFNSSLINIRVNQ